MKADLFVYQVACISLRSLSPPPWSKFTRMRGFIFTKKNTQTPSEVCPHSLCSCVFLDFLPISLSFSLIHSHPLIQTILDLQVSRASVNYRGTMDELIMIFFAQIIFFFVSVFCNKIKLLSCINECLVDHENNEVKQVLPSKHTNTYWNRKKMDYENILNIY